MEISDKLAFEIYTIIAFHLSALILLISFSTYLYLRAKKTPFLFSYMAVVGAIILWMMAKVLKTLAPTLHLRWLFILIQYLGIDLLGYFLLLFAFLYTNNRLPSKKHLIQLAILPLISFMAILTNPIHSSFYSYFDFYKDRFGPLFYSAQSIQYLYILSSILLLLYGFRRQRVYYEKKKFAVFFSCIALIPISTNIYYILFKMDFFKWFFPFPVFDFTPIAGSIGLVLFMIPILKFRFFDISPISYHLLFELIPQGVVVVNNRKILYGANNAFQRMFNTFQMQALPLEHFAATFIENPKRVFAFMEFISDPEVLAYELDTKDGRVFKIVKSPQKRGQTLLYFSDLTEINRNRKTLFRKNEELLHAHRQLDVMALKIKELAIAKTKAQMSQNVHDILGHSLTVVIGTMELAAGSGVQDMRAKLVQAKELLSSSLVDLQSVFQEQKNIWGGTSLIKALEHLKNENIQVDITAHGSIYELNSAQTEAMFRLCQEAVTNSIKHGNASRIYLILRYQPEEIEIYAIDNGKGCKEIQRSYGLSGIERRFSLLSGQIEFGSNPDAGFTIHGILPRNIHTEKG